MLKSKQLCQFTVAKDVVISYFRCLEKHKKKPGFFSEILEQNRAIFYYTLCMRSLEM